MRRRRQANLEKSARTRQLVFKLEHALRDAPVDSERIDTMFAQLSKLKGPNHPYVLKLRAYRLFKLGRYEQASRLYQRITALKSDDLEAGINLALIEMRMDQSQKALRRLDALREVYPDNTLLADLLKRLRP